MYSKQVVPGHKTPSLFHKKIYLTICNIAHVKVMFQMYDTERSTNLLVYLRIIQMPGS